MGRLDFCPEIFPDETLFSFVSRYHRLTGFREFRNTVELLFGTHKVSLHCDFPQYLHVASAMLFPEEEPSLVIDNLTIFPYFRPYLSSRQIEKATAYLTGRQTGAIKTLLGMVASQVGAATLYRYCPACLDADRCTYGQAYWHRIHQIPGVWVCPAHQLPLFEVDQAWMTGHRKRLVLPDEADVRKHSIPLPVISSRLDTLNRLAQVSAQILNANLGGVPPEVWRQLYLERAIELGLARPYGRLSLDALGSYLLSAIAKFPAEHEFRICELILGELPSWLLMLLRKQRRALHPLKHLLLSELLGLNSEDMLKAVQVTRLLDGAESSSQHEGKSSRASDELLCQIMTSSGGALTKVAEITGVSVTTLRLDAVRLGIPVDTRPKNLTPIVIGALERDFLAGLSLSGIAAKERLSIASLYRVLRMRPEIAVCWRAKRAKLELTRRRTRFLRDLRNKPLRRSPEYIWLYRNDRTWLQKKVADHGKAPRCAKERVDWKQRDQYLAQRVIAWSREALPQKGRPVRVTKSLIGRTLHISAVLDHHINRLPLTREAIALLIETREQFHFRRLIWARDQLLANGEPVVQWRLLRIASIRTPLSSEINQFVASLCRED